MGASCDELGRRRLICVSGTFIRLIDVLAAPPTLPIRRRKMRRTHLFTKNPLRFDAANDFLTALFYAKFFPSVFTSSVSSAIHIPSQSAHQSSRVQGCTASENLRVMLPAKRKRTHPDVADFLAVTPHADHAAVAVMQLRFPPTHRAPLIHQARPHIAWDVL